MHARRVPVTIDRLGDVPLYQQLADQLIAAIERGDLQPGDQLENELSLVERLDLSRPTVRRAIQELVDRALIVRRRGLGTHVANRQVHRRVELTSLYDDLAKDGRAPRTQVISHEVGPFPTAATALGLPDGTPLLQFRRLRFAGDRPLALMHNAIPDPGLDITTDELATTGLYELLRVRGMHPAVAQQNIGARMPSRDEHETLDLKGTQPLLTMTRVAFDGAGAGIEWGRHVYAASDYTFEMRIHER